MKILVERDVFDGNYTTGELLIDGMFECYTLEDTDRRLEDGGVKIYGQTAIPRGTYPVTLTYSQRFKKIMPLLWRVPGFEGVRIHAGNVPADTHGCVLVGTTRRAGAIENSRVAYAAVLNKIERAIDRGETVSLEVR